MDMQVLRQRVLDYIDEHREDVIEYLRQLIRVPSVNPGSMTILGHLMKTLCRT